MNRLITCYWNVYSLHVNISISKPLSLFKATYCNLMSITYKYCIFYTCVFIHTCNIYYYEFLWLYLLAVILTTGKKGW